jgi:cell division septal protein FtsQ
MKNKIKILPIKILILFILLSAIIFILFKFISTSEYFRIQYIITSEKDIRLDYLKGKSIFGINLKLVFERLIVDYPQYRIIRIGIQPPNCILVRAEKRRPIAYVRLYRDFAIDSEGVLFNVNEFNPDLPIVLGLENKLGYVKSGYKPKLRELQLVIKLIEEFNKIEKFKNFKIRNIKVESSFCLSFFIDNIEIKIDERIPEGLNLLLVVLSQLKDELDKVSYIDLRFKEPLVKYER